MGEELVSIIMPMYNAKKYIIETIKSVQLQTYEKWELLLVDDVSNDGTLAHLYECAEVIKDQRIQIIALEKNSGAARARNEGIARAKGRYIGFLDADDLWESQKLELQLSFLEKKKAGFSFTGYEFANELGQGLGKIVSVPESITYTQALRNTTIFTSTVLFDTKIISKDRICFPCVKSEDTALWWSILKEYKVAYGLNENLVRYRRIEGSLSADKKEALYRIWNLYRNVEKLSLIHSSYNFIFWAIRAVIRRS